MIEIRRQGSQGRIVDDAGAAVMCPKCHAIPVVYNGNYFCDGHGQWCDWALAHPARKPRDREFCDLLGLDYS